MNATTIHFLLLFSLLFCIGPLNARNDSNGKRDDTDEDEEPYESTEDFMFDENNESETKQNAMKELLFAWNDVDLCKDVECKSNEYCVMKSKALAVCVTKKRKKDTDDLLPSKRSGEPSASKWFAASNGKRNVAIEKCKSCPAMKPDFYCGTDNATYSSLCRLQFHNCVHNTNVEVACNGFCPCKAVKSHFEMAKVTRTKQRINKYLKGVREKSKFDKLDKLKQTVTPRINMHRSLADGFVASKRKQCTKAELDVMGSRLLDWFVVVSSDQLRLQKNAKTKKRLVGCKDEIGWMFHHFDVDNDMQLSIKKELYDLEHDEREKCLKQFLDGCDEDSDAYLKPYEWCNCFQKKNEPCIAAIKHSKKGLLGAFSPQCDSDGFYEPLQCNSSTGMCWCVDKNGVEFSNTRRRGKPDCDGLLKRAQKRTKFEDEDAENDSDDEDDDVGSGDGQNVV